MKNTLETKLETFTIEALKGIVVDFSNVLTEEGTSVFETALNILETKLSESDFIKICNAI